MLSLEERARRYATKAHAACDQRRKYTLEPYIVHPAAVVELVRSISAAEEMLAAAWLHDTVEDTGSTLTDIQQHFGPDVAMLVAMVTNPEQRPGTNRMYRKRAHFLHTANASPEAQTIKLADIIDNTRGILRYDPHFARVYLIEKRIQLAGLQRGNERLREQAEGIIEQGISQLMMPPYNVPAAWFAALMTRYQA
ncbi:bifunctional (p)ppGpp synthetase/guanosine-3',5'-bis(diphosphate) 3'-pyrophosphohydrolase [Buttiauxella warmboldiae]|uniref:Bifunctional (P)ppGpp synthetase/guanosine-3',5'-bis(Diphosphate) 3'-pyrophosphohydrolase n=1 Tax=Buttiauxella warmboldiae TaxID=82993 RepID=A0A3N5DAQ0_9ENTR|nr:HD domain-containing protein [Buttiauxella warmboldiae]RPH22152.1 bifunctional (p)ppGpp synthetase/guanosine-3',5'-bis(diphosphate) 3'-pyrophosphohydrolase [Buttiauxella warmboldiae]